MAAVFHSQFENKRAPFKWLFTFAQKLKIPLYILIFISKEKSIAFKNSCRQRLPANFQAANNEAK